MCLSFCGAQYRRGLRDLAGRIALGYRKSGALPHGVKQKRHAATAIGALAQRVIHLAGGDDGRRVGGAHPIHGGAYVVI